MRTVLLVGLILYCLSQALVPLAVEALTPPPGPVRLPEIAGNPEALARVVEEHKAAAVRGLRYWALAQYHALADQLTDETAIRVRRNQRWASSVVRWASWTSFLVLLFPIVAWRRYPGRRRVLVLSSLMATALLLIGMSLLGGLFTVVNSLGQNLASDLDPKRSMLDASFDLMLDRTIPLLVEGSVSWTTVIATGEGATTTTSGVSERLFENLAVLHEYAFDPAMKLFHAWRWFADKIPLFVIAATALLFLLSLRPVLQNLFTLPSRAASGQPRAIRGALGLLARTIAREFLSILVLLGAFILLSIEITGAMRQLSRPAVQVLVAQSEAAVDWLGVVEPDASLLVVVALSSLPFLLLASVALMAVSSVLWVFHARRICRARFHDGVRLRDHDRFWRRTSWALIQVHWIPVVYLTVARPLVVGVLEANGAASTRLTLSALVLLAGFAFTFWFFRGGRALRRLVRWSPETPEATQIHSPTPALDSVPSPRPRH